MTEEKNTSRQKNEIVFDDGRIEDIREFQSPEQLYRDLILRVRKYHPSDDITLIEKAYHLAFYHTSIRLSDHQHCALSFNSGILFLSNTGLLIPAFFWAT